MADEKTESTVSNSDEKRQQFGNRHLTDPSQVYKHNAWDNVDWDEEQEEEALLKIKANSEDLIPSDQKENYEENASDYWHEFYLQHQNRFFKDRHWLFTEFPELAPSSTTDNQAFNSKSLVDEMEKNTMNDADDYPGKSAHTKIFEVGCGVGNTVFPVLQTNSDPGVHVYCCDFADSAIKIVKNHPDYDEKRCTAFVADISSEDLSFPFPDASLDIIVLIFVLSAINPNKMQLVIDTLSRLLKPGGVILFRDYGRYDMAQLRFKRGKCLADNFYVRGDGTRVYFFTQDELAVMFKTAGLKEDQNHVDRRLQVNRGKQLKMYRIWIQCRYSKVAS